MSDAQSYRNSTRAGLAAVASAVLPGWGHLMVGQRRLGLGLLLIDIALVAIGAIGFLWFQTEVLKAWVTPWALTLILGLNVVAFLYRGAATADSFARAATKRGSDWLLAMLAVALVVLPHLFIGNLLLTQTDLIDSVFAQPDPVAAPAAPDTTAADTSASTVEPPSTTTTLPATSTTTPPRIWDGYERLNVLLLGSDAGVGRTGTRTDTIILLSIEPESGDAAMFSIPRNLTEAPLPEGMGIWDCNCFPDIITHLWANGEWYPDAFPGPQSPSVNALKAAIGLTFDLDIHYYAKVDLAGFVAMVDAIGGVTIDVPKRLVDEEYPHEEGGTEYLVFEEGPQHLDGHLTLAYSRIRRHSGDFARMHRQRCVLAALADQTSALDILRGYSDIAAAVKEHVETDIPIDDLPDLVDLFSRFDTDRLGTLRITRYNYGAGGHAGYQLYDLEQIRADARRLLADPTTRLGTQDGAGLEGTCDQSFD